MPCVYWQKSNHSKNKLTSISRNLRRQRALQLIKQRHMQHKHKQQQQQHMAPSVVFKYHTKGTKDKQEKFLFSRRKNVGKVSYTDDLN